MGDWDWVTIEELEHELKAARSAVRDLAGALASSAVQYAIEDLLTTHATTITKAQEE